MPNTNITGQVTDSAGNAVANAQVYLWREDLVGEGGAIVETITDSSGNYSFGAGEHPDADSDTHNWHVAAKKDGPNRQIQFESAWGIQARIPFSNITIDGFEVYNPANGIPSGAGYEDVNADSSAGVTQAEASDGTQSLNISGGGSPSSGFSTNITKNFDPRVTSGLRVSYYEGSSVGGGAIRWRSSSGEELCTVGTANPQVQVIFGGGSAEIVNSPSPEYNAFRRFTITPDFSAGTFDVVWEDLDGSSPDAALSGLDFVGAPDDVARVEFGSDSRGPGGMNATGDFFIDEVSSLTP
jgi:hypothetical protein